MEYADVNSGQPALVYKPQFFKFFFNIRASNFIYNIAN